MCIWPTAANLSGLVASGSICSTNLRCFPSLWPHGKNTQASKAAENIQELKPTQEERQCREEGWQAFETGGLNVEEFTAARMLFGISFLTLKPPQLGTRAFLLSVFFYLFIYSLAVKPRQIKQLSLYSHLRFRDRWTRTVNQVLLTGRDAKESKEPCANVWFVDVALRLVPVPFCVAVLTVRT